MICPKEKNNIITELNDLARKSMGVTCVLVQTHGINSLPQEDQSAIRELVEKFDEFNEDNDPYGEHDFGSFLYKGIKIFWKIDYYDKNLEFSSPNPADPSVTKRVLTIMLAEEY